MALDPAILGEPGTGNKRAVSTNKRYMQPTKKDLLGLLADVDRSVPERSKLVMVGAGDTAMTLLDLKPPAIHLDFTGPSADLAEFSRISAGVPNRGFQIHTWPDGLVFGQRLPEDYAKVSVRLSVDLARIDLRALQPLDIVVTKIERLTDDDVRDIKTCIRHFKLGKNQILKRARALQQVRDESRFERNLESVMSLFT